MTRKELFQQIKDAELVLVGIGEEFEGNYQDDTERDNSLVKAYEILKEQLEEKNFFVVSLCRDDLIYLSGLPADRIVKPLGNQKYLQCTKKCTDELFEAAKWEGERICPKCGAQMVYNQIGAEAYNENGYLPMWQKYTRWLTFTLNRRTLLLELGAGMKFPGIIRFPFEKTAFFNQSAQLVRVHKKLAFMPEELKGRGISVEGNAKEFILGE